jgi:hypothetical protein
MVSKNKLVASIFRNDQTIDVSKEFAGAFSDAKITDVSKEYGGSFRDCRSYRYFDGICRLIQEL